MRKALAALGAAGAIAALLFCFPLLPRIGPYGLAALGAAVALGWLVAWVHVRHVALGLLVAVAPVPGLAMGLAAGFSASLEAYGFGFAAGMVMAGVILRALLEGETREEGLARLLSVLGPLVLCFGAPGLARFWTQSTPLALCALTAALLLPAGLAFLPFGENFFTQANRARETRARLLGVLSALATPRWSLSLAGVALVLAALGAFEIALPPSGLWQPALALFAAMLVLSRDMRSALAVGLAIALLGLFVPGTAVGFCAFGFFALRLGMSARAAAAAENAWRFALEREAAAIFLAAFGMALMLAPVSRGDAFGVAAGAVAALVFLPALAGAVTLVWPRRRSVEELYRS